MSHFTDTDQKIDELGKKLALYKVNPSQMSPHDLSERLRIARLNATQLHQQTWKTKQVTHQQLQTQGGNSLSLKGGPHYEGLTPWFKLASFLPLLTLILGLFVISDYIDETRALELAPLDVSLLTDELPPEAYSDPGFSTYLKLQGQLDAE